MAVFHPRARFDSYVEGALPPASRERIAAHLALCGDCRREVQQRERILQFASSVHQPQADRRGPLGADPSSGLRASAGDAATAPVLEARDGVPGWKVVAGMGALGLAAVAVLGAAWIAGDPEAAAEAPGGDRLLPAASPSAASPGTDHDAGPGTERPASPSASGGEGSAPDGGGEPGPAVLSPAGVGGPTASPSVSSSATDPAGEESVHPEVALAGVVDLTPDMVTDLRQHGWNVPGLNGLGLLHDSTGWALVGDTAEVIMSLQGEQASLVLHECRSLAEDAGIPGCPVGAGLAGTGAPERTVATAGHTRELPVGVEMSVLDHGDGSWSATAHTAQAAYTVESDLPVERADRVMSLVVISERSRVQAGTDPERPADRLARGFERLLPWVEESEGERR